MCPSLCLDTRRELLCGAVLWKKLLLAAGGLCRAKRWNEEWWGRLWGCSVPQPELVLCTSPAHSRDELKRHYNLGEYWVEVEMEDLASFDEDLADYLYKQPAEHLQLVSGTLPQPPGLALPTTNSLCSLSSPAGGSCQGGG